MINKEKSRLKKLNNKGSALVTVVIVIAFITILATLILYLSVMNFQMKANDYRTKASFFGAEIPLEEIRVQMAIDMSVACEKAYANIMAQYDVVGDGAARKLAYNGEVLEEVKTIWNDRAKYIDPSGNVAYDWAQAIRTALQDTGSDEYCVTTGNEFTMKCSDADCSCAYHIILLDRGGAERIEFDSENATFHDVKVVYTENGFTSVITTDFSFLVPEYDWSVDEYTSTWVAGTDASVLQRTSIDYERCVVYLNYSKQ